MSAQSLVKCLVWDLDNTLWDGTLLEHDDVKIPTAVRDLVVALDRRGILQAVASRNDHDQAWTKLVDLGAAEYFVVAEIGWGNKSDSVRRIAERLRFDLATIAFVDDRPNERAEVAHHLPAVRCYAETDLDTLAARPEFSPARVTTDALARRAMYQANSRRTAAQDEFTGPDAEFLRTLDLVLRITRATEEDLARVEELTLRTSQMNATGVHYSQEVLRDMVDDLGHAVLVITMADRFGSHGAVGIVLLEQRPDRWRIRLLATSCRVVAYGAGAVILNWLVDAAAAAGVALLADFRATERNRMMEIAYRFAGFTDGDGPDGDGIQQLRITPERRAAPSTMTVHAPRL
jgi:methoxymalonate biosynthesis protein